MLVATAIRVDLIVMETFDVYGTLIPGPEAGAGRSFVVFEICRLETFMGSMTLFLMSGLIEKIRRIVGNAKCMALVAIGLLKTMWLN